MAAPLGHLEESEQRETQVDWTWPGIISAREAREQRLNTCREGRARRLAWTMIEDHRWVSVECHVSLLPEAREITAFGN